MKKLRWVLLFILLPIFSNAGQVSGYIGLKWIGGYTYQITVTDYTNGDPQNSGFCDPYDVDTLRLYILDGGLQSVLLNRNNGKGDSVCTCRKVNTYQTTYTFMGPGSYRIWFDAGPRVPNINNMTNSSFQDMFIFNSVFIPYGGGGNPSILINNPPLCTYGCPTQCYHFNLNAVSPSNNPLSYSLGPCLPGTGYYNPGATIDSNTGEFTWCNPTSVGLWSFSIRITTYSLTVKNGFPFRIPIDTEEVELQVDVENNCALGVNEVKNESEEVTVYPNPSNGIFTLALSHPVPMVIGVVPGTQTIEIYNVFGKRVYAATLKQVQGDNSIDMSTQPNGIYFYRVLNEDGGLIGDGKLMVEH